MLGRVFNDAARLRFLDVVSVAASVMSSCGLYQFDRQG